MRVAQLPAGYLALDRATTAIRESNVEADRVLGYAAGALIGRPLAELLPLASRVFVQTYVYPALARGERVDELYLTLRAHDGTPVPVVLNGRGTDDVIELVFLITPRGAITADEVDRARADAARAHARADAVHAQLALAERMASIGELAASVAHEINTPLAFVSANLELLAADPHISALTASATANLADVRLGVARIREVVASMQKLSRVEAVGVMPVELATVIDDALRVTAHILRGHARVVVELGEPPPIVLADASRLGQAVVNLLVNAAQVLPPRTVDTNVITVSAKALEGGARGELVVADNGPGIPPALQARIFEPFFTTKPIGEATGLGLSVCHTVVSQFGGTIVVESEPGHGARFVIRLPGVPQEVPAPRPVPPSQPPPLARPPRLRILVVDDDDGVGRVVRRIFREHAVDAAESSLEIWEQCERGELPTYDAVLCDLMMPDLSGIELFERVRAHDPALAARFIFLTGGAFTEEARTFLDRCGRPTVGKPFEIAALQAAVTALGPRDA